MGSAYTTIAADALARYHRLCQKQVTLVTGTDEHGEKIADSARAKGIDPQQHCDGIVESFKSLWEQVSTRSPRPPARGLASGLTDTDQDWQGWQGH